MFYVNNLDVGNQDKPMIALVSQSASEDQNLTAFIHPSSSPLKKRKGNVYRFLMSTLKEQMLAW